MREGGGGGGGGGGVAVSSVVRLGVRRREGGAIGLALLNVAPGSFAHN